jgi:hypothetical protein
VKCPAGFWGWIRAPGSGVPLYKAISGGHLRIGLILDLSRPSGSASGCEHVKECGIHPTIRPGSARMAVTVDGSCFTSAGRADRIWRSTAKATDVPIMQLAMAKRE